MENVKRHATELQRIQDEKPEDFEARTQGLKPEINNLLHVHLPGYITIRQAEIISMCVYKLIANPEEFIEL